MKVYDLWKKDNSDYPEEMQIILDYLKAHGDLKVSASTVEHLYREFSDTYCAGWLTVKNGEFLAEFAEWLDEYEL